MCKCVKKSVIWLCLLSVLSVLLYFPLNVFADTHEYGVFLGINGNEIPRLQGYKLVVIEPSEFSAEQVEQLHAAKSVVYGYLNIGAIEEYRRYYSQFETMLLDVYEDWPDERWVNVSIPAWKYFVVEKLGKKYAHLGLDGFFLDNADVYYHYPKEEIFQGLCSILQGLKQYNIPLIINGGDMFVSKCIEQQIAKDLFDAVNQETVFTSINFKNKTYGKQNTKETKYFADYLAKVKKHGLSVYLLEYAADEALTKKIDVYCKQNGYIWYNAKDLELR